MVRATLAHDEWIAEARAITVAAELTRRGHKVMHEQNGPCPACGGTDRFAVNLRQNVFICRAGGAGGDAIALCQHLDGSSFLGAVETLTGRAAPGRDEAETEQQRQARERRLADRARAAAAQRARDERAEAAEHARDLARCRTILRTAAPIAGTLAAAYLAARGIVLPPGFGEDLWFHPAVEYWGFPDAATRKLALLGRYPAMLGVISDADGAMVGLHRTWFDPEAPRKLTPPGDQARNPQKKVLGSNRGIIRLSPLRPHMVLGEGIESTLSGQHLGIGAPDACYASGVSLGNIAGRSTGFVPHPDHPDDSHRRVPNGMPDHQRPGVVLPDVVGAVTLLVDGDSDPVLTRAHMAVAGRRFSDLERRVSCNVAPAGMDHNDVLMQQRRAA